MLGHHLETKNELLKNQWLKPSFYLNFGSNRWISYYVFGLFGMFVGTLYFITFAKYFELPIWQTALTILAIYFLFFSASSFKYILTGVRRGMSFYRFQLAIIGLVILLSLLLNLPWPRYLDVAVLSVGWVLGFGRIGCTNVGCCHGKPSKFGLEYNAEHVKHGFPVGFLGVRLFPVLLIESVFVFIMLVISTILLIQRPVGGIVFSHYIAAYSLFRFLCEFWRGDIERLFFLDLSEAQWTSFFLLLSLVLFEIYGLLPFYQIHLFFWLAIVLGILLWKIFLNISPHYFKIFNPIHLLKLVSIIKELNEHTGNDLCIKGTSQGLNISKSKQDFGNDSQITYGISHNKTLLSPRVINRIANLIVILTNQTSTFTTQKTGNVFYVMFNVP